jgi:hypothetical protein
MQNFITLSNYGHHVSSLSHTININQKHINLSYKNYIYKNIINYDEILRNPINSPIIKTIFIVS